MGRTSVCLFGILILKMNNNFTLYIKMGAKHEEYTEEGNSWWGVGKLTLVV